MWPGRGAACTTWARKISAWSCMRCSLLRRSERILSGSCTASHWLACGPGCGGCWVRTPAGSGSGSLSRPIHGEPGKARAWHDRFVIRDIIDLHAVAGTFSYADLENLARRHDPDLDLEAIRDHLAGVSVFADEDFAEYGLDEPTIADLRNWVTGWYDDLALRLVADLTDDEV